MATYYNYVERTADSQINWAEVGKNMSDMLANENRIREEKKATIDADFREGMKKFSNSPDGEHVGARQAALEFGDNGSKYMLTLNKLLKSGNLSLKDYTIKTQNLLDGTDTAFSALKDYQAVYGKKMERARNGISSLYELRKMEQVEGFGDFSKSGFYISPADGRVLIAKKTKKNVDGQDVYVMDSAPGELASVDYVKGLILGEWNKFDTNAVTDSFAKGLGEEMKSIQTQIGTLSRTGLITSTSDITSRTDIDPDTKKILFKFVDAENQMIDSALANPFNRASVLTDNNVSASNGKLYDITSDPTKANANPNLILEVIDSATGRGTLKFTPEQIKASQDFMRNQVRAKYDYKEDIKTTPQTQLQERRALTPAEFERSDKSKEQQSVAGSWNQLYTGKTASEKKAAAEILLGTPRAQQLGLVDIDLETQPGKVLLKYVNNKMDRTIDLLDASKNPISLKDFSSKGVELHGVVDRDKAMKAGGGGTVFGRIADYKGIRASRRGVSSSFEPIVVPLNAITSESSEAANALQSSLPSGFKVKDTGGLIGNTVELTAPNGQVYKYTSKKGAVSSEAIKKDLEAFIRANNVSTGGTGGGELD